MCLYPQLIKNRKYIANKKNGGIIPPVSDLRLLYVPKECGKCMECRKKKSRSWQIRMKEELKVRKGIMVNLTFSNESIAELSAGIHRLTGYERDNEIASIGIRRFTERWRKKFKKAPRHWFVTELGHQGTENIHIHGILFENTNEIELREIWKYGHIVIGNYCTSRTINYIVKYITKIDEEHKYYNPRIFNSKGLGKEYVKREGIHKNKYKKETDESYINEKGFKQNLPMYYRNKIYTEEEREKLWLEKLDKKIRYVDGVKIDISKSDEEYFKALKIARAKNERLGYGNDEINWERKKYEQQLRNINYEKRVENLEKPKNRDKEEFKVKRKKPLIEPKEDNIEVDKVKKLDWKDAF